MAIIERSMEILMKLEHGNIKKALHKNPNETGYTYKGIYQSAWPLWDGWNYVMDGINQTDSLEEASIRLELYPTLQELVAEFYKKHFWDKAKLDDVESQKKADEIFIFGVNAGMKTGIKRAQTLVGTKPDGVIGPMSLRAINAFPEEEFDVGFDELEKEYYDAIIQKNPKLARYKKGWYNRAEAV